MTPKKTIGKLANHQKDRPAGVLTRLRHLNRLTVFGIILFFVLLSMFILIGALLIRYESERHRQNEIEFVQQKLDEMGESLKNRINNNISKVSAVKALVAMNPQLTQDDFARGITVQFEGEHDLRNIGLARNMILKYMYPVEGNEAAIGLDYRTIPDQLDAVELALRTNKIVLAGPLTLVQGGEGIIARIPIRLQDKVLNRDEFWGFASVVMNSGSILEGAGIKQEQGGLLVALRGRDAMGEKGDVFLGDPWVFENNPLTKHIQLPYGSWQIGAIPHGGWTIFSPLSNPLIYIYLFFSLVILAFIAFIVFLLYKRDKMQKERNTLTNSLEVILNQTSDFIYYKDINSQFVFCSQTLANITNHKHWKEMTGKHDFDVFPHDTATIYAEEEEPVFREGKAVLNKINPYYNQSGEKGYIQTNKWPVFDDNKKVIGIFGISRDITEHKKAVDALEKERNIFAEGPVFTMEWGTEPIDNLPLKSVSSNVEKIIGYTPTEMLHPDFSYSQLIHPDDVVDIIKKTESNTEDPSIHSFEQSYRLKTKSGNFIWVYDFNTLVRNKEGNLTAIRSYMYDQTAQKDAEEALRIVEERLEKTAYDLTENIPVGTYTMVQPASGGMASFAFMSSRFLELTGLTREEAASDPLKAFACVHRDDYDQWVAMNIRAFEEKTPFFGETRVVINGEERWIIAESKPRTLSDGTTVWEGVLADITDRKRAEKALSESLARFNDLVAHVSVGVYVFWHRANGRTEFEYVSDGWCTMNKISREDILADAQVAFKLIHPEDLQDFLNLNEGAIRERKRFSWEGRIVINGHVSFALIESTPVFFDNGDSRWFGIQKDMTEHKLINDQLIEEKEKAEAANVAKSQFLANMSHEIRTPMNSILGFSEIMLNTTTDTNQKQYLKTILNSGQALMLLINDILDLSKIEAGKLEVSPGFTDIKSLMTEMKQIFIPKTEEKNLKFIVKLDPEMPESIFIDEVRLRQILLNLIGNAVKFTHSGGITVYTRIEKQKDKEYDFIIDIEDTGIGINPKDQQRIFESFTQQQGQDNKKYGGTGLGLSISKRLCELMNGAIGVTSTPGEGSCFTLRFKNVAITEQSSQQRNQFEWDEHPVEFSGQKVLIVDDLANNRKLIKDYLQTYDLKIMEAKSGEEAVEFAKAYLPDIILMDIRMPGIGGYEATKIIKSGKDTKTIPIVALTAFIMQSETNQINGLFDACLRKPVQKKSIIQQLAAYLQHISLEGNAKESVDMETIQQPDVVETTLRQKFTELFGEEIKHQKKVMYLKRMHNLYGKIKEFALHNNLSALSAHCEELKESIDGYDFEGIKRKLDEILALYTLSIDD